MGDQLQLQWFYPKHKSECHIGLLILRPYTRKTSPENICLWKPVGLTFRSPRVLWEKEAPLLRLAHKIPHTSGPRAEAKICRKSGSDLLADPGWWRGTWNQRFQDPVLPTSGPISTSGPPQTYNFSWQDPELLQAGWHQPLYLLSHSPIQK